MGNFIAFFYLTKPIELWYYIYKKMGGGETPPDVVMTLQQPLLF